jgi:lysophospholipase L1-like esterase
MMRRFGFWLLLVTNILSLVALGLLIDRIGGLRYTWYRYKTNDLGSKLMRAEHLGELHPQTGNKRVIVMFGDSQVQNAEWNEMLGSDSLVLLNRGISGENIEGVISRAPDIAKLKPSAIVVWVGINDLFYRKSASEVAKMYDDMLSKLKQVFGETPLFVCTLAPVQAGVRHLPTDAKPIHEFNTALASLTKKHQVQLLDLAKPLSDAEGNLKTEFTLDGVHLTHAAYDLIKHEIAQAIGAK